ncbi:hypothetical protein EC973_002767 [Apophysomyces ossiformis]|uniref:Oligopeptide transporter n=1 Tax=Apophysomyces ossiformis TaxID=679940 RepID=A0A8H7BXJ1_9FUNG|nr:hypothetical protein EC973_002767 [Apophysomyces ossiformis]
MSLQASLVGFAIFKPFQHKLKAHFGPVENVVLQTVAVATATMPLAAGFVGVIPALELMTTADNPDGPIVLSAWKLILWSLGVAFFGVFFAVPLRTQTIVREKLRFPSGTATAQMISLLHQQPDPTINNTATLRQRHVSHFAERELSPSPADHYPTPVALLPVTQAEVQPGADHEHTFEETWALKLRALVFSFSLSSLYTVLSYFFPIIYALPIFNWLTLNLVDFRAWEWYFTPSLSYVGQGIIMGLPTTLSMLSGCVVGWGILSPIAYYAGWAPGPISDWKTGSKGWILWVSLGVMVAESIVSLGIVVFRAVAKATKKDDDLDRSMYHAMPTTADDASIAEEEIAREWSDEDEEIHDAPSDQLVPSWVTVVGLIASTILCIAMITLIFGTDVLPTSMSLLAIVIAMFLSVLGVRALGETDLNPVSGIGKISQVIFALVIPGGIAANLIAGGIAEAGAQQAGDLMQDLKTGHLLHASPKAQFYGQLIGSFVSAFVATGAYLLYTHVYTIPGPEFPAPTAQVWLDMSRLVNGHPLPPHVQEFVLAFAIIFGVLVLVKDTGNSRGWRRYIPQGIAFAIGMYNPPSFTLARVIGGCLGHAWNTYCDKPEDSRIKSAILATCREKAGKILIIIVASGFVLGEGTFAIVNMIMQACHVPHL